MSEVLHDKKMKELMNDISPNKILDVGGGTQTGPFLREIFPRTEIDALNISKEELESVKTLYERVYVCDCQDMKPLKDNSFDIIYSNQVLEHLFYPEKFLKEARRVLKPQGLLILSTPNLSAWFNRLLLLFGYQLSNYTASSEFKNIGLPKFIKKKNLWDHTRIFSPHALKDMLELTGFEIIKMEIINNTYKNQPYEKLRWFVGKIIPKNWRECIIVKARKA